MPETDTLIKTTCPRDCYDACGMSVRVRGGVIQNVMGDRGHHVAQGKLCGKCAIAYNGVFRDAEKRLSVPLRRVGKKGEGVFEPVSWDAALADIAARLKKISDPRTIYHTHYTGTLSMIAGGFPGRFFNRLGATEVDPDTVCNKAGHVVLADMFGTSLSGFDPEQIGQRPLPDGLGRQPFAQRAAHALRLGEIHGRGSSLSSIPSPPARRSWPTFTCNCGPGSDAALAFGMLHVIKKAGLFDHAFIEKHVLGFDGVEAEIDAATPERTAALTGVDAALIEKAALVFAQGPSLLWLGQGVQRQPKGGNVFRALPLLNIATGQLGKPGAGFCYMNGAETRGVDAGFIAGSAATPPSAIWIWPLISTTRRKCRRSSPGTTTSWPQAPARKPSARAWRARTCSPSWPTSS